MTNEHIREQSESDIQDDVKKSPILSALSSYFKKWAAEDKTLQFKSAAGLRREADL